MMAAAGLGAPRGGDEEVTEAGDRNDPIDVMKALIAKGATVNAANDAGMTPLHYAAQRGSDRIVEFLASQGARFDLKNKQGRTPSELARGKTAALMNKLSGAATTQQASGFSRPWRSCWTVRPPEGGHYVTSIIPSEFRPGSERVEPRQVEPIETSGCTYVALPERDERRSRDRSGAKERDPSMTNGAHASVRCPPRRLQHNRSARAHQLNAVGRPDSEPAVDDDVECASPRVRQERCMIPIDART